MSAVRQSDIKSVVASFYTHESVDGAQLTDYVSRILHRIRNYPQKTQRVRDLHQQMQTLLGRRYLAELSLEDIFQWNSLFRAMIKCVGLPRIINFTGTGTRTRYPGTRTRTKTG